MAAVTTIRHKRGDTFLFDAVLKESKTGPVIDLTGWSIASKLRDRTDLLIDTATVTVTNAAAGAYTVEVTDTTAWPLDTIYWDVEYIDAGGIIRSTETVSVQVVKDITRP